MTVTLAHPDASWRYSPAYADIFEKKFAIDHSGSFGKPGVGIRVQIKVVPLSTWASIEFGPPAKRMTNFATGGCVDPDPSNSWLRPGELEGSTRWGRHR